MTTDANGADQVDVVVVGAGIAGIYMTHRMREQGLNVLGIERGADVGGTWFWNRYPGARCDQESLYYSYSFDPDLEQTWEWTERYATQPEILSYLSHVADRLDIRRSFAFGTAVTAVTFDDGNQRWTVETDTGASISCQFVIMASGCLSEPNVPALPGLDRFAGQLLSTATWPKDGVDLTGQRVAVIGTGSSGIQCIPLIAEIAEHLTVFQRTPSFSLPAKNAPLDADAVATVKASYQDIRVLMRGSNFGSPRIIESTQSALEATDEERIAAYEAAFEFGHLGAMLQTYTDLLTNREANETVAEYARSRIRGAVNDPVVAERLVPNGYPIGTKRPCLDTNYYATFNRPNVSLVSTRETPITEVTPTGIATGDTQVDVDVIVLATGFDAITGALLKVDIRGRGGVALRDQWRAGPSAYLGVAVHGFPNLFTVTGPGSPSVLSNMVVSIEQHVEWIAACIAHMRAAGDQTVDVDPTAEQQWMETVAEVASQTLFLDANSWYLGANIEGKPRVFMPFVGGVGRFREICDKVVAQDYRGFVFAGARAPQGAKSDF